VAIGLAPGLAGVKKKNWFGAGPAVGELRITLSSISIDMFKSSSITICIGDEAAFAAIGENGVAGLTETNRPEKSKSKSKSKKTIQALLVIVIQFWSI